MSHLPGKAALRLSGIAVAIAIGAIVVGLIVDKDRNGWLAGMIFVLIALGCYLVSFYQRSDLEPTRTGVLGLFLIFGSVPAGVATGLAGYNGWSCGLVLLVCGLIALVIGGILMRKQLR